MNAVERFFFGMALLTGGGCYVELAAPSFIGSLFVLSMIGAGSTMAWRALQ